MAKNTPPATPPVENTPPEAPPVPETPPKVDAPPHVPEAPPVPVKRYSVSCEDVTVEVTARDEIEAWAKFNDATGKMRPPGVARTIVEMPS